jgi:hypothetical protein
VACGRKVVRDLGGVSSAPEVSVLAEGPFARTCVPTTRLSRSCGGGQVPLTGKGSPR